MVLQEKVYGASGKSLWCFRKKSMVLQEKVYGANPQKSPYLWAFLRVYIKYRNQV